MLHEFPKIWELIALVDDRESHQAFFQNFEEDMIREPLKKATFLRLEAEIKRLPSDAWEMLKRKISPYLNVRHERRGWQQLIDHLNEVKGYNHLIGMGCEKVSFIQENTEKKTPDLEAYLNGERILCEVKTINISDVEIQPRENTEIVGDSSPSIDNALLGKLSCAAQVAEGQIDSYCPNHTRKIVYFVVHFDDWTHDYQNEYFKQIRQHFNDKPVGNLEIILCEQPNF